MKRLTALLILCMLLGLDAYAGPPTIINSGSASAGILTDSNCDQAKYYAIGKLCQDTDDGKLYKGIGSGVEEIVAASLATYTQPDADNKLVGRTGDGTVGVVTAPVGLTLTSSSHTGSTNTIKTIKYLTLTNPQYCDETNAVLDTTKTDGAKFGQCAFRNEVDKDKNYAVYELTVPPDIDTSVDLKARIYYRLGGADTGTHTYTLSLSSVAASASSAGSFGQEITFNAAADASGADGDIEITPALASAMTTLTDWKTNLTAGQLLLIMLKRDGDAAEDASTVDSYSNKVVISYGSTQ